MFRFVDGTIPETEANWLSYNPIIPYGEVALSVDTGNIKVGDGIRQWADIPYTSGSIGSRSTDTRAPVDDEIPYYNDSLYKWTYRLQGKLDTASNWNSNNTVYPKYTLCLELNDTTNDPTGRFKIGDGTNAFNLLPWAGSDVDLTDFPVGYSIEFNGTYMEPAHYIKVGESISAETPTGDRFACDDGQWKQINDVYVEGPLSSLNGTIPIFDGTTGHKLIDSELSLSSFPTSGGTQNETFRIGNSGPQLYNDSGNLKLLTNDLLSSADLSIHTLFSEYATVHDTLVIGFPTEPTSVSLTTDGTYLYVDSGKVFTHLTDGTGSGLDADMLDGKHANEFATTGDITTTIDDALTYSIIFGG